MKYHLHDKLILADIECKVAFIDCEHNAYLVPEADGDSYNNYALFKGLVFAIIDKKGRDNLGNRAVSIVNQECCAV